MPSKDLIDDVAAWALQHGAFINCLRIIDQFMVTKSQGQQLITYLLTHPRITTEHRWERCINTGGGCSRMLMVRVIEITPIPSGPIKPYKETLHQKLRRLVDLMPPY